MNQTLQAPRLDRLRQGLDLAVERLYIQKARKGLPADMRQGSPEGAATTTGKPLRAFWM